MSRPARPRLSLVVATYNRPASLERLLRDLARQTLPAEEFEALVVDDGSQPDPSPRLRALELPFACQVARQENAGPAAARHRGIELSRGDVVVIVDDDMELPPEFLAEHARLHAPGARRVVLGHIRPAPDLERLPLFERFHAEMLDRFVAGVRAGRLRLNGTHVCTGNVSFPRADYFAVGGFDRGLDRSEDAELGLRLEQAGLELCFSEKAFTRHASDHSRLEVWMRRAYRYGLNDLRIRRRHPGTPEASPWRFFFLMHPLARPLLALAVLWPALGGLVAQAGMRLSLLLDRLGLARPAIAGTTVVYGLEYHRGLRAEAGSLRAAWADLRAYLRQRRPRGPVEP